MKDINIALLGLGTVGTGVVNILEENKLQLEKTMDARITVKHIFVKNVNKDRAINTERYHLTDDINDILNDHTLDIAIEVMGGIDTTYHYLKQLMTSGVHVITANKDLLAVHLEELETLAAEREISLKYEASVAGGIPIVNAINNGLNANGIKHFMGIFNGTSNFILSKMALEGQSFEEALAAATELGYAEADPTADVDGIDAQRKVVITSYLAFNQFMTLDDCAVEGIRNVTSTDIKLAGELGYTIKLIGQAYAENDRVEASVKPTCLPVHHQLAHVDYEYNAIYIDGSAVGDTMYYGRGAGSLATGSAVVSDLLHVIRYIDTKLHTLPPHFEIETKALDRSRHLLVIGDETVTKTFAGRTVTTGETTAVELLNVSTAVFDEVAALDDVKIYEIEGV
ncbi:homoserine dehydrogenase [Macrococcus equipercicus]|uniref:Homoserine dehydrogenase n=1 Tax=Macrococcus equipercicus TaxID=69967 RepID=A0A9Q9BWR1_9STAP|nr:homoserine dehydrogenase [Macrococcus equipercicus]UTH14792.1 homoserine dehydrogenase [Macrococcus equipercicus]